MSGVREQNKILPNFQVVFPQQCYYRHVATTSATTVIPLAGQHHLETNGTAATALSISLPPQANIDSIFRQLKLGLRPIDLIQELNVNFFCPLGLDGN